ncbi:hypothetical protein M436DRAFT_76601 [Aureobasidium namibiae CBS 147.97]|uniref:Protein kinase domain-containing protein n=1 Tax=Aureobasidium namibiae CBS 147.97 TaxID=1043004 RepID=A0A074W6X0_9PEZI|nr:uncharacterized protein M436DRAFT_76601 [Aureobasidium namibiae CBS 147.97]KEQ68880.1 hypothetical protein M436DRAFT_76601 [Aureobasidium namibiae CBS 147.97]
MSIVLKVELEQPSTGIPAQKMILKVYDRQHSLELRKSLSTGPATKASEEQFATFLRGGLLPPFLAECEENGAWVSSVYAQWGVEGREALAYMKSTQSHEVELKVYEQLVDMQGVHVPTIFADVRLPPQHAAMEKDESLAHYTEIRAILMEHISGFPLSDLVTEVPESAWASVCDQAIEIIREIAEHDFINFDVKPRNTIVRPSEESLYHVFYLDFGECCVRDPSESDGIWQERKRQRNEEGAVGFVMMNYISRAKGKNGRKYKGTLPLPWEYKPSLRFQGDYFSQCNKTSRVKYRAETS